MEKQRKHETKVERCESDECSHEHRFKYQPVIIPLTVASCTKCGFTQVFYLTEVVYETYLAAPIVAGLGVQLMSIVKEFLANAVKKR